MSVVRLPWVGVRYALHVIIDAIVYTFHMAIASLPAGLLYLVLQRVPALNRQLESTPIQQVSPTDLQQFAFSLGQALGGGVPTPPSDVDADGSAGGDSEGVELSEPSPSDPLAAFRAQFSAFGACAAPS